ncbi:hypothetical protein B0H66DRAFT_272755 [Apodospora peruviana]|uniref:Secreted protein n=1 Tax=Apodospora peruviana TaxID=516989 RepID=A0AAE0HZL6_9PEZI|nr:hypothetical protein B0H66DRAFT_272755 [Apodospora peruviana]
MPGHSIIFIATNWPVVAISELVCGASARWWHGMRVVAPYRPPSTPLLTGDAACLNCTIGLPSVLFTTQQLIGNGGDIGRAKERQSGSAPWSLYVQQLTLVARDLHHECCSPSPSAVVLIAGDLWPINYREKGNDLPLWNPRRNSLLGMLATVPPAPTNSLGTADPTCETSMCCCSMLPCHIGFASSTVLPD